MPLTPQAANSATTDAAGGTHVFRFAIGEKVTIQVSGERGEVIARSEHRNAADQYLVRYQAADGRATDAWWPAEALDAAAIFISYWADVAASSAAAPAVPTASLSDLGGHYTGAPAYLDLLVRCHEALRLMQCLYECDLLITAPEKVSEVRSAIEDVEVYRQQLQRLRPPFVPQQPDRG